MSAETNLIQGENMKRQAVVTELYKRLLELYDEADSEPPKADEPIISAQIYEITGAIYLLDYRFYMVNCRKADLPARERERG